MGSIFVGFNGTCSAMIKRIHKLEIKTQVTRNAPRKEGRVDRGRALFSGLDGNLGKCDVQQELIASAAQSVGETILSNATGGEMKTRSQVSPHLNSYLS